MAVRLAACIHRNRHGMFYFRHIVPVDLREVVQVREVRLSLHTERRQEAIQAALPIITTRPSMLAALRRMTSNDDEDGKARAARYHQAWITEVRRRLALVERVEELESALHDARVQLARSVPKANAKQLARQAWAEGQLRGKNDLEKRLIFPWPPERTVPFSELLDAYLSDLMARAEGGRRKPPGPKVMDAYRSEIGEFVEVMGDMRIGEINRRVADEFFTKLRRLPANRNRVKAYANKSAVELLAMSPPPPPAVRAERIQKSRTHLSHV